MQSAEQPLRGAARAVRPDRLSKLMWLVAAVMAVAGLSGCAEPSPQVQVATADASRSATASWIPLDIRRQRRSRGGSDRGTGAECYGCDSVRGCNTARYDSGQFDTPGGDRGTGAECNGCDSGRGCNTARYDSGQFNTSGSALDTAGRTAGGVRTSAGGAGNRGAADCGSS
jgi:hypothetical protein